MDGYIVTELRSKYIVIKSVEKITNKQVKNLTLNYNYGEIRKGLSI